MVQRITISSQQYQENRLILQPEQIHYLLRVLRLSAGDRFIAQDGTGQQWLAALSEKPAQADIIEAIAPPPNPSAPLRLVAALPKGNSFDQVVRQATELGVTHIYPVLTERTLLKPSDNKLTRWRRIAQEASEQSERITVPDIFTPMAFPHYLQQDSESGLPHQPKGLRYLCAARNNGSLSNPEAKLPHLLSQLMAELASADSPSVTLAIGPEGGWTPNEITVASRYHYKVVTLGSVILRAVTAPITALSLVTAARELLI
ncbi:MAG: 16S rRNA (uracil(1498)-N(3))-methyltransferase [Phormidesmis sp. RL_2_1]|nr:16S rRNA (uracil(1498)-N(3))-methyltransferase [Phormidesmis sp. RL_2_1]